MNTVLQDLRGGLRAAVRAPALHLFATLTIAIGVGANTAMFSIVNAVLLRPLPYAEPDRLVTVHVDLPGLGVANAGFSVPEIEDLAARRDVFDAFAPTWVIDANVTGGDRPERIVALATSPDYFRLLGVPPLRGRLLGETDRTAGFSEAAIISHAAWQRMFGGDPSAIGRRIRIDTDLYTIVGIMPPGFRHPAPASVPEVDVWLAAGFRAAPFPADPSRRRRVLPGAVARLAPQLTMEQGADALRTVAAAWRNTHPADYPADAQLTLRLMPLRDAVVGRVDRVLLALSGAVMLILLIGCANVANLMLAGSTAREQEMAIRQAMGAERGRIAAQLLTEHLGLALAGGLAGVVAVSWTQALVVASLPAGVPRAHEIGVDGRVLLFSLGITLLASILCGMAPAVAAGRALPLAALTENGRGSTSSRRVGRIRTALVVAEIALSLMLVAGAGLLLRTVAGLLRVDPGFSTERVLVGRTWIAVPNNPELDRYRTAPARAALARGILDRLREIPEVSAAAATTVLPLSESQVKVPVQIAGRPNEADARTASVSIVTPDYFSILNVPPRRGRTFAESDDGDGQPVALLSESAAQRFFHDEDPIGQRIQVGRPGADAPVLTVVGVVGDVKYETLDAAASPHVYLSLYQRSGRSLSLVMKTKVSPAGLQRAVEEAVRRMDADLPVFGVQSLDERVAASILPHRFSMQAVAWFAALALLLAAIGVYGVMTCSVSSRTREIGVRMAMGATPGAVLVSVLRDSLRAALAGVAAGILLSAAAFQSIRGMLFDVAPVDPLVLTSAGVVLLVVALLAAYWPARRAARVDPLVSLRG